MLRTAALIQGFVRVPEPEPEPDRPGRTGTPLLEGDTTPGLTYHAHLNFDLAGFKQQVKSLSLFSYSISLSPAMTS